MSPTWNDGMLEYWVLENWDIGLLAIFFLTPKLLLFKYSKNSFNFCKLYNFQDVNYSDDWVPMSPVGLTIRTTNMIKSPNIVAMTPP